MFDFGDIKKTEEIIRDTWNEFRNALASAKFEYDEIEKAKEIVFLKQFDDYFNKNECKKYFTKTLKQLIDEEYVFARGTKLRDGETVNYDRFMPISKYISKDNRFSPVGVEWLYLAYGYCGDEKYRKETAEKCTVKECKAEIGQRFGICHFLINEAFDNSKVVDLTIADELTYNALNNSLEAYGRKVRKKAIQLAKIGLKSHISEMEFKEEFAKWFSYTDAKLISEQLFLPVESGEEKYMYAPFQCLAQYFKSLGYVGILYSSTVYPKAKNIVLFDKAMGIPTGDIKDFVVE